MTLRFARVTSLNLLRLLSVGFLLSQFGACKTLSTPAKKTADDIASQDPIASGPAGPKRPQSAIQPPQYKAVGRIQAKLEGAALRLGKAQQLTGIGRNSDARFSRSGDRLVLTSLRPPLPRVSLVTISSDGHNEALVDGPQQAVRSAAFWRNDLVFVVEKQAASGQFLHLKDEHSAAIVQDASQGLSEIADLAVSTGSDELFFSALAKASATNPSPKRALFVLSADGSKLSQLSDGQNQDREPSPSADGQSIAFRRQLDPEHSEIFLLHRPSGQIFALTTLGGQNWSPAISPRGDVVVWSSSYYGERDHDLFALQLGQDFAQRLTTTAGFDGMPSFAPDGQSLCWTSSRQGGLPQIFIAAWQSSPAPAK